MISSIARTTETTKTMRRTFWKQPLIKTTPIQRSDDLRHNFRGPQKDDNDNFCPHLSRNSRCNIQSTFSTSGVGVILYLNSSEATSSIWRIICLPSEGYLEPLLGNVPRFRRLEGACAASQFGPLRSPWHNPLTLGGAWITFVIQKLIKV